MHSMLSNSPVLPAHSSEEKIKSRTIFLYDFIEESSILEVIKQIHTINESDKVETIKFLGTYGTLPTPTPITIQIESRGGLVRDGFALISAIEQSTTPIITRVNGYAFSMGLTIFLAGHERHMSRHASLMYHQISGGLYGNLKEMDERLEVSKELQEQIEDYVMERTKWEKKDLNKIYKLKEDYYLRADQALKNGFATKII